ncbi:MAG: hypothetical protein A2X08_12135 [Bacteroidetes bacterium GWA2_32_17]|nr:MAG: hypothetical protein A2X08_12135 [Bacteroidetes bacterium GWA2_32_17]
MLNFIIITFTILISTMGFSQNFLIEQKKNARVKTAYSEKEKIVKGYFTSNKIEYNNFDLYIRIFKQEKVVEVWVKNKNSNSYTNIVNYDICSTSGALGPKRRQGDGQTPEGFYVVNRFNPYSNFYLSLGLNFPNNADKIITKGFKAGGDIFIHGNCVTIGCVPITDDKIKELYIIATEAKAHGQNNIPVHIFPCKMSEDKMLELNNLNTENYSFWQSIKPSYDYFEKNKSIPIISVDKKGNYIFK